MEDITEDNNASMVEPHVDDVINLPTPSSNFEQNLLFLISYSFIGALALFGNFMIVYIIGSCKKMQNFIYILLANMAAADLLCAFTYFTGLLACSDVVISGTGSNLWCLANKTVWLITFQVNAFYKDKPWSLDLHSFVRIAISFVLNVKFDN